jgi:Zn finger protein HypA/HybF involved in hydrogenase expression
LSVISAVVDTVEEYLKARQADGAAETAAAGDGVSLRVTRVALQVGERSSYVPSYIKEIWPLAVNDSPLGGADLEIESIEGADFFIKEIEIEE